MLMRTELVDWADFRQEMMSPHSICGIITNADGHRSLLAWQGQRRAMVFVASYKKCGKKGHRADKCWLKTPLSFHCLAWQGQAGHTEVFQFREVWTFACQLSEQE